MCASDYPLADWSWPAVVKAINTHHSDQYNARLARQFREMSRNKVFDRRSRKKYAEMAEKIESQSGGR